MAYMECTSLEGNPTLSQRLRILYLRNFKHLVVDNKWTPTKFSLSVREVFKWVVTVGLSGIIIYLVTIMTQPTSSQTEIQLNEVNKNLETVSKQLDKISDSNYDIKTISITVDSIKLRAKEILKTIEKHKLQQTSKPNT